jgi:hypothetical protein
MNLDNRIIDLDKSLNEIELPAFFYELSKPINMTLCAGDGIQSEITDIESFTSGKEEYGRNKKPTRVFMTTKNYNQEGLNMNKKYLNDNKDLKVLLLIYDDTSIKYKENLVNLFSNTFGNIFEDSSCYGDKLDLKILYEILDNEGEYFPNYMEKITNFIKQIYIYDEYLKYFTITINGGINNSIKKDNGNKLILNKIMDTKYTSPPYSLWIEEYNSAIQEYYDRKNLDTIDSEYRKKTKEKLTNCTSDSDCKFFGKNGTCEEDNHCYFDSKGGNKKKTKKRKQKKKTKKRKTKKYKRILRKTKNIK